MTAVKSFQMAAKKEAGREEHPALEYEFLTPEGDARTVTARFPGDGALMLLIAASGGEDGMAAATELFALLAETFDEADMAFLKKSYRSAILDTDMLMDLVMDMVERWSSFPTQPPSDSSPKRPSTGTKSTGRAPGKGSTRSS